MILDYPPISKLKNHLIVFLIYYYAYGLKIRTKWGHITLDPGIIFLTKKN
jgi:hypothetical protein